MIKRVSLAWLCLPLLCASSAGAFSDPNQFSVDSAVGGGGGRFFTGSPRDGYSCAVCHRGGEVPTVQVDGLPVLFEAGQLYQVQLRWDGALASHALHLELVTKSGEHPEVTIEPDAVLHDDGRCDGDPEGEPANYSIEDGSRRIVGVRDCGASRVAVQFVAPDSEELYFSASVVRSDSSGSAKGDGVLDLRRVLVKRGTVKSGSGCATLGQTGSVDATLWLALLTLLFQRRSRPTTRVVSSASTRERPTNAR